MGPNGHINHHANHHLGPPAPPPKPRRHFNFADLYTSSWGKKYPVDEYGRRDSDTISDGDIELVFLAKIAEEMVGVRRDLAKLRKTPTQPKPKPEPKKFTTADWKRIDERLSLRRAWDAYLKAGGQPDETTPADLRQKYAPSAGVYATPVADLNLSVRARRCMNRLDIATVGELCQRTADELMGAKNFGTTSLVEVRGKLAALGVSLAGEEEVRDE